MLITVTRWTTGFGCQNYHQLIHSKDSKMFEANEDPVNLSSMQTPLDFFMYGEEGGTKYGLMCLICRQYVCCCQCAQFYHPSLHYSDHHVNMFHAPSQSRSLSLSLITGHKVVLLQFTRCLSMSIYSRL